MRFTLGWLKDFLETDASLIEITDRLTSIGLEVEEVIDYAKDLAQFKVAEIIEAVPHPEADRLRVCKVNDGKAILQIVCGAPNARAGIKVVLAQVGAIIPTNGMKIKLSKIRNVESQGMMCSARELGIGEEHDGIIELESDAIIGDNFTKSYGIDDPIIDISITPNRGDCLGVYGIARDLAATGIGKLKAIEIPTFPCEFESPIKISNADCPLFIGYYFKDVENKDSPKFLKKRLKAIGDTPISLLVDITNYINLSFGRPLHVFDADQIKGDICVRAARNEKISCLNELEYQLDSNDIVVADSENPLAIAGIMGGMESRCRLDSRNIFLEAAMFDVDLLIDTGRKLKIDSDARYRFERQVDHNFTHIGAKLAAKMILEYAGGKISHPVISGDEFALPRNLVFNPDKVKNLGGVDLSLDRITGILVGLGFVVKNQDQKLHLTIPSWRNDISIEADIVEEIVRINGFDNIPLTMLPRNKMVYSNGLTEKLRRVGVIKRKLAITGYDEVVSWSFIPCEMARLFGELDDSLVLANPISSELGYMRNSILPNLIEMARKNINRNISNISIFEVGSIFNGITPDKQHKMVSGIKVGKTSKKNIYKTEREFDFYDVKSDVAKILEEAGISFDNLVLSDDVPDYYHPKRAAKILLGKLVIGYFGNLHPSLLADMSFNNNIVAFEIFVDNLPVMRAKHGRKPSYKISDYQSISRDFAFVVDRNLAADNLVKLVKSSDNQLIKEVSIFDIYQGDKIEDDKKSVAINVVIQGHDRTLTEQEIESLSNNIINLIADKAGGKLR